MLDDTSNFESLREDLKKLHAQCERLRGDAAKTAQDAAMVFERIAELQRSLEAADEGGR